MIEVISGTNRPGSNTLRVARIIESLYHDLGVQAQILDLQDMPAAIFNPASYLQKPEGWSLITDRILASKGLHIVTPEYNGSFPGVLKYFIDMLPFPASFEHRCVAFTGHSAGLWGAFRAVEQMQMIFGYRNAYILPERVWLNQISSRLDENGKLLNEADINMLNTQAGKFVDYINKLA